MDQLMGCSLTLVTITRSLVLVIIKLLIASVSAGHTIKPNYSQEKSEISSHTTEVITILPVSSSR